MRVKMLAEISGTRDGVPWPAVGDVCDVPDIEAAELVAAGYAETVAAAPKPSSVKKSAAAKKA